MPDGFESYNRTDYLSVIDKCAVSEELFWHLNSQIMKEVKNCFMNLNIPKP
jgi:hypothetical protein